MPEFWILKIQNLNNGILKQTFEVRDEPVMLIKFAPASVASALATRVLPVPGGPKSNIPLHGWKIASHNYTMKKNRANFHLVSIKMHYIDIYSVPLTNFHEKRAQVSSLEEWQVHSRPFSHLREHQHHQISHQFHWEVPQLRQNYSHTHPLQGSAKSYNS